MTRGVTQRHAALTALVCGLVVSVSGCVYGFSGGGLPSHVKTMAVVPFDNQTAIADVQRELSDSLRACLINRLGVRSASVEKANAVVRGSIKSYQADVPVGYTSGTNTATNARRLLQISLDIQVVDQVTGKSLWEKKGFIAEGQYEEQREAQGRARAIDRIVNAIVEGIQSQW